MTTPTTTLTLIIDGLTYLHGNTLEDLRQQLLSRAAALTALAEGEVVNVEVKAAKPKREAKAAKEPEVEQAAAPELDAAKRDIPPGGEKSPASTDGTSTSGSTPSSGPTATSGASPSDVVTYEDVRGAVTKLASIKGRDAALGVLDGFGVDHGSKLTEDQWAPAYAALTAALDENLA